MVNLVCSHRFWFGDNTQSHVIINAHSAIRQVSSAILSISQRSEMRKVELSGDKENCVYKLRVYALSLASSNKVIKDK